MNMRGDESRRTERQKVRRFRRRGWGVYNRAPGLGYQTTCQRCYGGMYDLDDVDDEGVCGTCRNRELARLNVERLEAWAARKTRRWLAEWFALASPIRAHSQRRTFPRWVFTWETSGERRELRKIVEWLMADYRGRGKRFTVHEPPDAQEQQTPQAIVEDWPEVAGR
jgi:hypothetical protein